MSKLKHMAAIMAVGGTLAAGTALTASAAQGEVLEFDLMYNGFSTATWDQSVPAEASAGGQGSTDVTVTDGSDSRGGTFTVVDYLHQGLYIKDSKSNVIDIDSTPQVFTGTQTDPIFTPTAGVPISFYSSPYTLTITAVPEPATWAMMLIGVFGLGAVLRTRRGQRLATA